VVFASRRARLNAGHRATQHASATSARSASAPAPLPGLLVCISPPGFAPVPSRSDPTRLLQHTWGACCTRVLGSIAAADMISAISRHRRVHSFVGTVMARYPVGLAGGCGHGHPYLGGAYPFSEPCALAGRQNHTTARLSQTVGLEGGPYNRGAW